MEKLEEICFLIISKSGEAKSLAFEALDFGKKGEFSKANIKIEGSYNSIREAHSFQTSLIQEEAQGAGVKPSVLLIHAQDHLMSTMLALELIEEIIELYKKVL